MRDTVHIHDREQLKLNLIRDFRVFYKTYRQWLEPYLQAMEDREAYEELVRRVMYAAEEAGFSGNVWQCVITESLFLDENPFSLASEMCGDCDGTIRE
ncbi:MAG: hypothetical protein J6X66_01530, partial [Lachnospiraceae bacterium]|nr:hypothetical protein [Lachnospiraceae bacterium]